MKKRKMLNVVLWLGLCLNFVPLTAYTQQLYGEELCQEDINYFCYKVKKGETWESLWSDPEIRLEAQKINRLNTPLKSGAILAVPNFPVNYFTEYCPFELKIEYVGIKTLIWDPNLLAWAAYDEKGDLVRWGPGVGGKDYCADVGRSCRTISGMYEIIYIGGPYYRSSKYPRGCKNNCALMPYAMFFSPGYAFHAGKLYGDHSSHGCIRLFEDDAKWLNEQFVELNTQVIIYPYK